ncbi:MAG: Rv0361 family membrane protein [Jatrophihabitans sp.]|uniref:Rv0361 family membrane protein n=1 Tax=Jatrophihabitans sp. TaxID=1932789 RepID=UPI003F7CF90A
MTDGNQPWHDWNDPTGAGPSQPQDGQPQYGQPDPGYGQPQYGQPQYGQPQYGQPQYGQPQYGQPDPGYGQYGQPQIGQPGYGTPPGFPPPGGTGAGTGGRGNRGLLLGIVALVVVAALGIGAYVVFSGSDSSGTSAKQAAAAFVTGLNKGDLGQVKANLCKQDLADSGLDAKISGAQAAAKNFSVTSVTTSGSTGTARISLTAAGQSVTFPFVLTKEGSDWKVCVSRSNAFTDQSGSGGGSVSSAPSLPSSAPSLPSNIPGVPSSIPALPTGVPSIPSFGNACASVSSQPVAAAAFYVEAASIGQAQLAQTCVYHDAVPASVAQSLDGGQYEPDASTIAGTGPYLFTGTKRVTVTVSKEPDGHYYVTKVEVG